MQTEIWLWGPQYAPLLPQTLLELARHKGPLRHIAVDAGVFVKEQLPKPHQSDFIAIGDGDSSAPELMNQLHPQDKNLSDLSLALKFITDTCKSSHRIRALGFSGGRLDHHMIAQGCFSRFLSHNPGTQIRLDDQWLLLAEGKWSGQLDASTVSILTYAETEIELTGDWRWCLDKTKLAVLDDRLLSNECGGAPLMINCSMPLAIYSEATICDWWTYD